MRRINRGVDLLNRLACFKDKFNFFKDTSYSMESLKNELIIHIYWLHTKSVFLVIFRLP